MLMKKQDVEIQSGQARLVGNSDGVGFPFWVQEIGAWDLFVSNCKEKRVIVMFWTSSILSWVCARSGHTCLKSSVKQEQIRKHIKINSKILVKTEHFDPGRKEKKISLSNIFNWVHLQNYQEAHTHVAGKEDVFKTISSLLSQVSVYILCPLSLCISTDLWNWSL